MKPSIGKLYDALGELIYAVAMADGKVQGEEIKKLHELLIAHPNARAIQWSFDYEKRTRDTLEEAYAKAMDTCKAYGPTEEYVFLFEALDQIAAASHGIDADELAVIDRFKKELKEHFMKLDLRDLDGPG